MMRAIARPTQEPKVYIRDRLAAPPPPPYLFSSTPRISYYQSVMPAHLRGKARLYTSTAHMNRLETRRQREREEYRVLI